MRGEVNGCPAPRSCGGWCPIPLAGNAFRSCGGRNTGIQFETRFQYNMGPDGKKRLPVFSSHESLKAYTADSQADQYYLQTKGTWVFQLRFEEIDEVWIDPAQPEAIFYGKSISRGSANWRPRSRSRKISPNYAKATPAMARASASGITRHTGSS